MYSSHQRYSSALNGTSPDEIVERAVAGVKRAVSYRDDVEFSPEDACRTEYISCRVVEAAIDAGARTVNIPDTVGYATPGEIYDRFRMLQDRVPNIDKAVVSTHRHDDLGMAVANSLVAVAAGAVKSSANQWNWRACRQRCISPDNPDEE